MSKYPDEGVKETEEVLASLEKRINKEYSQAEAEISKKLDEYLRKFEVKDSLKQQAVVNGQITQSEYEQWRVGQIAIGKRWEEMKTTIAEDLTHTAEIAKSITYGTMPEVYAINHNYGTYEVESLSNVDTSYTLYDHSTVEKLFDDNNTIYHAPGAKVSEDINTGKQMAWDKKQVQSVMTQSLLQGESIGKIATRLSKTVGESDRKAAIRNARTMTTGVQNAGRVDSYQRAEDMGIAVEQEWLATLDDRTRHEHRMLDGQRVKVGEKFHVGNYEIAYPGDPMAAAFLVYNCRCTLIAALRNHEKDSSDLSNRNTENMSQETYDEWKESHEIKSDSILKQDGIESAMIEANVNTYKSYNSLNINSNNGIIKSIDVEDFTIAADAHNLNPDVTKTITSVIESYENKGEFYISEFYFGSLDKVGNSTPVLQVEPIADRTLRLNVNTDIVAGKTVSELDEIFKNAKNTVANSWEEATIHECGHAKTIKNKTVSEIEEIYEKLSSVHISGISAKAYGDGAEAIAEIEVLLSRGESVSEEAMSLYTEYTK